MNEITAITVSKNYSDFLDLCIKHNYDMFYKWYIITQEDDTKTIKLIEKYNLSNIELCFYPLDPEKSGIDHTTMPFEDEAAKILYHYKCGKEEFRCVPEKLADVKPTQDKFGSYFTNNRICFDKGGAIRMAQNLVNSVKEKRLILVMDSDIIISDELKSFVLVSSFENDTLYGALRQDYVSYDDLINKKNNKPYFRNYIKDQIDGYFQLYVNDPKYLYSRSISAGACDSHFSFQFPKREKVKNFCFHMGQDIPRTNWAGRTTKEFK